MKLLLVACIAASCLYPIDLQAVDRSSSERARFAKMAPCPVDGVAKYFNCKGYSIDPIKPICAGGSDTADNFQWLRNEHKKFKDAIDNAYCRCVKKFGTDGCQTVTWKATPEVKK